ncbi:ABC transporter permease [Rhizobium leguminosarum]|uniref:ABC transporter permease n=1 Tax=Rhizobium leguminosarum TaxID=384 RepID=UPI001440FA3A|nr:ABC transporter permease [Rhizobium leguminosarum]NKL53433.1 ABC transporter permease subunit [Rhizobium leguminosarum bv. viciae]
MSSIAFPGSNQNKSRATALLMPALIVNIIGFVWPLGLLAVISLRDTATSGAFGLTFSLSTWRTVLLDPHYYWLLLSTLKIAAITMVATLIVSFPVAMFVYRSSPRIKGPLIVVCIMPLLISAVIRTYGWIVILGDQGLVPSAIRALGGTPYPMLFNTFGLVTGMVEILMPYMILALLSGFGRLDNSLEEAAASLGANKFTVLWRITVPLAAPGILLGCFLVFVLTISAFITPKILGGGRVPLLATEIYDQAVLTLNWPVAAVLSYITLFIFGIVVIFYVKLIRMVD